MNSNNYTRILKPKKLKKKSSFKLTQQNGVRREK